MYEEGKAGHIGECMRWGGVLDEVCRLYPMAKSQTASTKYAVSRLGFCSERVIRPTEPITPPERAAIDAHIAQWREYAALA